jgi:hypothetical protein
MTTSKKEKTEMLEYGAEMDCFPGCQRCVHFEKDTKLCIKGIVITEEHKADGKNFCLEFTE